jgi:hypothetical protein
VKPVHTAVLKEARVLGGYNRVADVWRHLVVINRDAVLVVKLGYLYRLTILGRVKGRRLGSVDWLDVVRKVLEDGDTG